MAIGSHLKLRSRRLALRFFAICLTQSVVMTYFVLDYTDGQKPQPFAPVEMKGAAGQFTINKALDQLWTGNENPEEFKLASFTCHCRPHTTASEAELAAQKRQSQIERMIDDFEVGFTADEITQITQVIDSESRRYKFDPRLLMAVILTESSMRIQAVSCQGAHGLMQIKPEVAEDLALQQGTEWRGQTSLFDPILNIKLGSYYLFELIIKYGDIHKALVAYNMGETAMRNCLLADRQLPSEYVEKVMSRYQELVVKYPDA